MSIELSLSKFNAVSLTDLKSVRLMNRTDTKFIFQKAKLTDLFRELNNSYNILEVKGSRVQRYKSLYYDTEDKFFFQQHHNNRVNRNKVRFREYVDSNLVFLEVKLKNNKGKTIKKRVQVNEIPSSLSISQKKYINEAIGAELDLISQQWINFNRITFVDKMYTERLTIDLDLTFSNTVKSGSFESIVVAEVKKDRVAQSSKFTLLAKRHHILPARLSKYCISTVNLNKDVKYNRFKEKVLLINKLTNI